MTFLQVGLGAAALMMPTDGSQFTELRSLDAPGYTGGPLVVRDGDPPHLVLGSPQVGAGRGIVLVGTLVSGMFADLRSECIHCNYGYSLACLNIAQDGSFGLAIGSPALAASTVLSTVSGAGRLELREYPSGKTRWSLNGEAGISSFGMAIVALPDVDGDQMADLAVASISREDQAQPPMGRVEIRSGDTGTLILTIPGRSRGFGATLCATSGLDDRHGHDVVIGAPDDEGGGAVYRYSVGSGQLVWRAAAPGTKGAFGGLVVNAGDINRDGATDFLVAQSTLAGDVVALSGIDGAFLYRIGGNAPFDAFGSSICLISDTDGDSICEFVVGAPASNTPFRDSGSIRLCRGRDGAPLGEYRGRAPGEGLGRSIAMIPEHSGSRGHWIDVLVGSLDSIKVVRITQ